MLTLVATYHRTIHASLERIWENVRDWEHLPWLHRAFFSKIALLEETPTSWRARVVMPPATAPREAVVEVEMDQPRTRYWSRTLTEQGLSGEILTQLTPVSELETNIVVEFRGQVANPQHAEQLGSMYLRLYEQLWDEDERMMQRRQELIEAGRIGITSKPLKNKRTSDGTQQP
ncbi:MAG: hypothetical protein HYZ50_00795 [Deltaproteobacteria bacterium]|nr:hypothetical protein [Deltaproteobacteria bacterium]